MTISNYNTGIPAQLELFTVYFPGIPYRRSGLAEGGMMLIAFRLPAKDSGVKVNEPGDVVRTDTYAGKFHALTR